MSIKVRYDIPYNINIPSRTVLYVENRYDDKINTFIRENYEEISSMFKEKDMYFMYIPNLTALIPETARQYIFGTDSFNIESPKDTANALERILPAEILSRIDSPALCSFGSYKMILYRLDSSDFQLDIFHKYFTTKSIDEYKFEEYEENKVCETENVFTAFGYDSESIYSQVRFRKKDRDDDYITKFNHELDIDEHNLSKEQKKLIFQAQQNVKKLMDSGLSVELIHALLEPQIKLSRLQITKDFRIFLLDYDEKEIVLGPMEKTVFLFFLRHPEGVNFKYLIDYEDELMTIYSKLTNRIVAAVMRRSISSLVDPTKNNINEKCSRIKRTFLAELALPLAKEYYIDGQLGGEKRITLDRSLVRWDCSI